MTGPAPSAFNRITHSPLYLSAIATVVSLALAGVINYFVLSAAALPTTLFITLMIAAPMSYATIKLVTNMRSTIETQKVKLALEQERADILAKFMRDAAHEFKTPLTLMTTDMYMAERVTEVEKKQQYFVNLNEQVQYLNNLLETILILTRLDSTAKGDYAVTKMPVADLLSNIRSLTNNNKVELIFEKLDNTTFINVNMPDLHLAIKHIVDNAIRFAPEARTVIIEMSSLLHSLYIQIIDRGFGMSAEAIPHIFERFYRADESHTTRGLGLGLAIVKRVVELHGGQIKVESEVGKGTTFTISLPTNRAS